MTENDLTVPLRSSSDPIPPPGLGFPEVTPVDRGDQDPTTLDSLLMDPTAVDPQKAGRFAPRPPVTLIRWPSEPDPGEGLKGTPGDTVEAPIVWGQEREASGARPRSQDLRPPPPLSLAREPRQESGWVAFGEPTEVAQPMRLEPEAAAPAVRPEAPAEPAAPLASTPASAPPRRIVGPGVRLKEIVRPAPADPLPPSSEGASSQGGSSPEPVLEPSRPLEPPLPHRRPRPSDGEWGPEEWGPALLLLVALLAGLLLGLTVFKHRTLLGLPTPGTPVQAPRDL